MTYSAPSARASLNQTLGRTLRRATGTLLAAAATLCLAACTPADTLTRAEGDARQTEVTTLQQRLAQLEATVKQLASRSTAPAEPAVVALPDSTDPSRRLGRADAPVVIVEFSDLQCPYCRRFDQQTLPWLRKEYIDTGKVRFESRDYPLEFHAQAVAAALLARCAAREGKFWELREAVFSVQASLAGDGLDQAAKAVGLAPELRPGHWRAWHAIVFDRTRSERESRRNPSSRRWPAGNLPQAYRPAAGCRRKALSRLGDGKGRGQHNFRTSGCWKASRWACCRGWQCVRR